MDIPYRPSLFRMLIGLGSFMFLICPFYVLEFFYPTCLGANGLAFLSFALFHILEGILFFFLAFAIRKGTSGRKICHSLARYEFIMTPITTVSVLSVAAIFPLAERDWLYFFNLGVTGFHILIRFLLILYLNVLIRSHEIGHVSVRNHAYIGMCILFVTLNYYVFGAIKGIGLDMDLLFGGDFRGINEGFLVLSILEVIAGVLVLLQGVFLTIATYSSYKEGTMIDLRANAAISKTLIEKYDIRFHVSTFASLICLALAGFSCFASLEAYLPLVILHAVTLAVRIPSYAYKRRVLRKYDEPRIIFRKQHGLLLYGAALLLAYSIVSFVSGRAVFQHFAESEMTLFMTFGLFVPWAVVKGALGVAGLINSRKKGEPLALLNSFLDITLALFTLAEALSVVAVKANLPTFQLAAKITAHVFGAACLILAILLLVIGIVGSRGKREKAFHRFLSYTKKDEKENH